jgi:hypothetical protein
MLRLENVSDDQFRVAMETVSRMGVAKKKEKLFFQSCYIVKLNGIYYLVNYKEIIGKEMTDSDHARTNTVAVLLDKWDLIKIAEKTDIDKFGTQPTIFVIPYKAKGNYQVKGRIPNYKISKFISENREKNVVPKTVTI